MQTEMLEVFCEVARQRSITGAAATLRYTQSAVSRQMAALEAEFGAPLFDRLPRGVALTAEGRCLLEHATAVLARLTTARREVTAVRDALTGRLRVGAFATADAALVPRALARFRASHPGVEIALIEGLTTRLLTSLLVGDADVVLVNAGADRPFADDRFHLHAVANEPLLLAVAATHPLAVAATHRRAARVHPGAPAAVGPETVDAPGSTTIADMSEISPMHGCIWRDELADEAWVAGSARPEETLLAASARLGFRPRIEFVVQEWTAKFGFVAAGLGITLVPALAARTVPSDVVLLPLNPAHFPPRRVQAATLAARTVPSVVTAFLDLIREEASAVCDTQPA
ncbi:LysR family transcriptional regulator [Dactylosporangium sp. NPDC051541]|uniref:LysR family transcriptional regulator n=1 Tax=Dactylosporangium sp. NPDC051541 TaxID=3363977 RepID=UPI0037B081AF